MPQPLPQITINELIRSIKSHKVSKLTFSSDLTKVISENILHEQEETSISPIIVQKLVDTSLENQISTIFETSRFDFTNLLAPITFIGSLFFINSVFSRSTRNMLLPNNKLEIPQKHNITLNDWAGSEEVLLECSEIVSYLRNNTNYIKAGAKIPKGILLEGNPGTGKTLLAKAIAGEAEANFISITGSEFVELFVGLGASRVRQLFAEARKKSPTIIFIDEIDAVGRQRGAGINMGNDEREQTLNQLLAEMDGFNSNEQIIVIAATNRKDILDSALLRPGRFDRLINIPLPDLPSRIKILEVHLRNKFVTEDVNIENIAKLTNGFSGAQLENLINEAAILAARNGQVFITPTFFLDALEKITIGIIKKTETRSQDTLTRVALHELGHAFMVLFYKEYFKLQKISIQSTYSGMGGFTAYEQQDDTEDGMFTKEMLKNRIAILLGGKAAETIFYGADFCSVGATADLQQSNELVRRMISNFGFGKDLEVFYDSSSNNNLPFLGRDFGHQSTYSDDTRNQIDKEALELLNEAFEISKSIITANKHKIELALIELLDKKIMSGNELETFFI
jgi:cell division protease FtsH